MSAAENDAPSDAPEGVTPTRPVSEVGWSTPPPASAEKDALLAPLYALADEWRRDPGRTWVASCGDDLRDTLDDLARNIPPEGQR